MSGWYDEEPEAAKPQEAAPAPSVPSSPDVPFRDRPFNLNAEQAVLGSVLIDPKLLATILLQVDDFYLPAHREIWDAMKAIAKRQIVVDPITLGDELKSRGVTNRIEGGEGYFSVLANATPTTLNVHAHEAVVRRDSLRRHFAGFGAEIASIALSDGTEITQLISESRQHLVKLTASGNGRQQSMRELIDSELADIEKKAGDQEAIYGVPIGLRAADKLVRGFKTEDLVIIAAGPSLGKTAFMMQIVSDLALKYAKPSLYLTCEDTPGNLLHRLIARQTRIDVEKFRSGDLNHLDWRRVNEFTAKLLESKFEMRRVTTLEDVISEAWSWRMEHGDELAAVAVDYLQRVQVPVARGENREREVHKIAAGLKNLARELKCPVLTGSQFGREFDKEKRKPRLSDLRESGSIEQEADVVMMLHRDREQLQGEADLIIGKARNGKTGTVPTMWIGAYQTYDDPSTDTAAFTPGPNDWHDRED